MGKRLPTGFSLEQDQDGDWILLPPDHVTIFSVPGEGLLIGRCNEATALGDALEHLSGLGLSSHPSGGDRHGE